MSGKVQEERAYSHANKLIRNDPLYVVTVFPDTDSQYVSQIYAGLYDLAYTGHIRLIFSKNNFSKDSNSKHSFATLIMEVTHVQSNRSRIIFFDMVDGSQTFMMHELSHVDVYFKRSYEESYINSMTENLRNKILPYGLHYACRSRNESPLMLLRRQLIYTSIRKEYLTNPIKSLKQTLGRYIKKLLIESLLDKQVKSWPLFTNQFEVLPDEPAIRKIYFRTRVYDISNEATDYNTSQRIKVNQMRVGIIRELKSKFGQEFLGGLRWSQYAQDNYPDCMYPEAINTAQHIENTKKYLININTDGLHGSVGWKFPEYIAASRCIVSEPINVKLPEPIKEGSHYLSFRTPHDCVRACEALLNNTTFDSSMQKINYDYYYNNLTPSNLIYKCLEAAFSKQLDT